MFECLSGFSLGSVVGLMLLCKDCLFYVRMCVCLCVLACVRVRALLAYVCVCECACLVVWLRW